MVLEMEVEGLLHGYLDHTKIKRNRKFGTPKFTRRRFTETKTKTPTCTTAPEGEGGRGIHESAG
jgi:hypothetical protein